MTNNSYSCISVLKCGKMKLDGITDDAFVLGDILNGRIDLLTNEKLSTVYGKTSAWENFHVLVTNDYCQ